MNMRRRLEKLEVDPIKDLTKYRLHFVNNWESDPPRPNPQAGVELITVRFVDAALNRVKLGLA